MKIKLSEHFYSIQGEGKTAGFPAVFIRLAGCNLLCGGAKTHIDKKLHDGATWRCDTIEAWMAGKDYELEDLLNELVAAYSFKDTQVVITGGEPFMNPEKVQAIIEVLEQKIGFELSGKIEIETNCTIAPSVKNDFFITKDIQFNCSPKLSNSGMSKEIRYKIDVVKEFNKLNSIFKFVVNNQNDCDEILDDYLPYIDHDRVYLMPAADYRQGYIEKSLEIADFCKKYHFKFSPRHHLMIWDKKTGV